MYNNNTSAKIQSQKFLKVIFFSNHTSFSSRIFYLSSTLHRRWHVIFASRATSNVKYIPIHVQTPRVFLLSFPLELLLFFFHFLIISLLLFLYKNQHTVIHTHTLLELLIARLGFSFFFFQRLFPFSLLYIFFFIQ